MMILVTSCRWTGIRAGSGTVWDGMPYRHFVGGLAANHTSPLSFLRNTNCFIVLVYYWLAIEGLCWCTICALCVLLSCISTCMF